jgi:hypothetical protein
MCHHFRLERLMNELMKVIKPDWVSHWRIILGSYSTWSNTYSLSIEVIVKSREYDEITSQGEWRFGQIKMQTNTYVREYLSNYIAKCGISSCNFYIESSSTSMCEENYTKDIIFV